MARSNSPQATDLNELQLIDEEESRQFVMVVDGHRVRMEYDRTPDRIFLTHVQVPPAVESSEVAAVLTEKVLGWVESNNMRMVPYCPYVKTYLRKNTSWQRLLVKGVQI